MQSGFAKQKKQSAQKGAQPALKIGGLVLLRKAFIKTQPAVGGFH
jgi:hypothetical protein